jgi:hypothetical protein
LGVFFLIIGRMEAVSELTIALIIDICRSF